MPFIVYEADLSGDGSDSLSGNRVLYIAWDITTLGVIAHQGTGVVTDAVIGFGGVALGDNFDIVGGSPVDRWHEFLWFNQTYGLWTPIPAGDGSGFFSAVATRIKWNIVSDGAAHIRVFGDNV